MLSNPPLWTAEEILLVTDGILISGNPNVEVNGVTFFLRHIHPGDLFILANPKIWGKKYKDLSHKIPNIIKAGANIILSDQPLKNVPKDYPIIQVENSLQALKKLGIYARERFKGTVICITGSVGKSSTKECLHHVLSQQGSAHKTTGNFNCQYGLPLSLAQTPRNYQFGIFESSLSYQGTSLAKFKSVSPNIAIITEIQPDHLQFCSSLEEIADNKAKIFDALEPDGTAILNRDNPFYERLKKHALEVGVKNFISFGTHSEADCRLLNCQCDIDKSIVNASVYGKKLEYVINVPGKHMVMNSLAVLAAVVAAKADLNQAALSLSTMYSLPRHTNFKKIPYKTGNIFLIDDTYSANPASIKAGCEYANLIGKKFHSRILLVLGDMQELGAQSSQLHASLAPILIDNNIHKAFLIGSKIESLWKNLPNDMKGIHTLDTNELLHSLNNELKENDTILVKTSFRTHEMKPILAALNNPNSNITSQTHINDRIKPIKIIDCTKMEKQTFSLLLVGDTSHGENYQKDIESHNGINILNKMGYDYPLKRMKPMLESCDEVIANLETPFTDIETSPYVKMKSYIHKSHIQKSPESLLKHNINVISLANNHAYDYGLEGFNQTLSVLEANNIMYFGGGKNEKDADEPFIYQLNFKENKVHIAIVGGFQESENYRKNFNCYAKKNKCGISAFNADKLKETISNLRKFDPNIYIILYPHWGKNYHGRSSKQAKLAELLINAGADLIIGHGAHMLQEIEVINHRWVIYSLGNFMFNSPGRYKQLHVPPYSLVTKIFVTSESNGVTLKVRLYPIVTDNLQTKYQPRPVDDYEFGNVCRFLECQKISPESNLYALAREKDDLGYYLELPKEYIISESVGMMCNINQTVNPRNSDAYWVFRALTMNNTLKENNIRLIVFSPNSININSRKTFGYVIENDIFTKIISPIPLINYLWFMSSNKIIYDHFIKYISWSEKMGYQNYPKISFIKLTEDKYLSFQAIEKIRPSLFLYSELFNHTLDQMQSFLARSHIIFLKPRFGGGGNGIIVIKNSINFFTANRYKDKKQTTLQKNTLEEILAQVTIWISTRHYIIQTGIDVPTYHNRKFDIRFTMLNNGNSPFAIYESRLSKKNSDVSNVSQGGTNIDTKKILNELFGIDKANQLIDQLSHLSYELFDMLEDHNHKHIIEVSLDWVIDKSGKCFLNEIQTHPGIAGHPHLFVDFFDRSAKENAIFEQYTQPHGDYLAKFLLSKYLNIKRK